MNQTAATTVGNPRRNIFAQCRVCGIFGHHTTNILENNWRIEQGNTYNLSETIFKCVGLRVERDHRLGTKICDNCFRTINEFVWFRDRCIAAETQMNALIGLRNCPDDVNINNEDDRRPHNHADEDEMTSEDEEEFHDSLEDLDENPSIDTGTHRRPDVLETNANHSGLSSADVNMNEWDNNIGHNDETTDDGMSENENSIVSEGASDTQSSSGENASFISASPHRIPRIRNEQESGARDTFHSTSGRPQSEEEEDEANTEPPPSAEMNSSETIVNEGPGTNNVNVNDGKSDDGLSDGIANGEESNDSGGQAIPLSHTNHREPITPEMLDDGYEQPQSEQDESEIHLEVFQDIDTGANANQQIGIEGPSSCPVIQIANNGNGTTMPKRRAHKRPPLKQIQNVNSANRVSAVVNNRIASVVRRSLSPRNFLRNGIISEDSGTESEPEKFSVPCIHGKCMDMFEDIDAMLLHQQTFHDANRVPEFTCLVCGRCYARRHLLKAHMNSRHHQ